MQNEKGDDMRKWKYIEPGDDGITPVEHILTDEEILKQYRAYWTERMCIVGKANEISEENCIQDWVVIHWAEEIL